MMKKALFLFIVISIIAGVSQKLYYAYRLSGYIDCDTATIGLMAQDVFSGKFNTFFYGQNYNGALESFWLAPFILLFGSKTMVLYIGMIFLFLLFLLTIYKMGSLIGSKDIGFFAMAYCAVSTYPLLHNSVFPYGYHMALLVLGNLVLIITLLIDKDEKNILLWLLLGLCAGLGFWNHFTIVYYLAPAGLFLCFKRNIFKNFKYYLIGLISFIFGSIPFWIYNLRTNFSSFNIRDGKPYRYYPVDISLLDTFKRLIKYHISGILGIQEFNIFGFSIWFLFIISGIIFLVKLNRKKILIFLFMLSFFGFSLSQKFFVMSPKYCYFIPFYVLSGLFFANLAGLFNQKYRYLGMTLIFFILIFNINDFAVSTQEGRYNENDDEKEYIKKTEGYNVLINFLKTKKIGGVIADFGTIQGLNFMTDKKIAGAEFINGRPPTDELVQSRDRLAIFDCMDFLKETLDVICKSYKTAQIGSFNIAYDFKPYGYFGRSIDADNWKGFSNYNGKDAGYGFDRGMDKFWTSEKDKLPGMYYKIDLGKIYRIYKIDVVNIFPHLDNYPYKYKIEVSSDGRKWNLIKKSSRPQPLFWSGTRIYWDYFNGRWEIVFEPVEARYIRIRQTDFGQWAWMINELFIYEYLGKKEHGNKGYIKSAKQLYKYLSGDKIKFVYADFWLSAKIRLWSKGRIEALRIFNDCYPERKNTSRLMKIDEDTAIVIEKSEKNDLEKILSKFNLPVCKKYFGDYICYEFFKLNEWQKYFLNNQKCLYWTGFSMAEINMHIYSWLLADYGRMLEEKGDTVDSTEYYKTALNVFPRNNIALERLAKIDKKYFIKFKHLCRPETAKKAEFANGIVFMGYRLLCYKDKLRMEYYWHMPEQIPKDLAVFVHFYKDDKLVFQNDHNLLEYYPKPVISLNDWIFTEKYWIKLPENIEHGVYEINIGLYNPTTGKRVKAGRSSLTKFEIGTVEINPAPSNGH